MKTSSRSIFSLEPDFRVATCFGCACSGACHQVVLDPPTSIRQRCLDQWHDLITVFLFLESGQARAEFYQAGQAVRRCGSGTLAAAHVLHRELNLPVQTIETDAADLSLQIRGEYLGYAATRLPTRPAPDESLWSALVDQNIHGCQLIGDADDYCFLELENEEAVGRASVNFQALEKRGRALVLTAPAETKPFHYVFRYFAPQYGVAESAVTASVNADLACYWSRRFNRGQLRARQLSSSGAVFTVEVERERVWVFGRTGRSG